MKLVRITLYLALLLLTQCSSCKNADPAPNRPPTTLPAETQKGAYTLGCLVNSKTFVATTILQVSAEWQDVHSLAVRSTYKTKTTTQSIGIILNGELATGKRFTLVPFSKTINPAANELVVSYSDLTCTYEGNRIKSRELTLTKFDGVARIAAGRFAFTLHEPGCDTLRVTEGRFDVRF